MPQLLHAVDREELDDLHHRYGRAPHRPIEMAVDSPFLDGKHQLLTNRDRRAEICYVLHRGDPADGLLLHRKAFYPDQAYRLPTGGIHEGESVLETLAREIEEETSFLLAIDGVLARNVPDRVTVELQAYLGVLQYALHHRSEERTHYFATYHFLVEAPARAAPRSLDPEEQVAGWEWRSAAEMAATADLLDAVGQTHPDWADWGRFRGLSHRFVAEQLVSSHPSAG